MSEFSEKTRAVFKAGDDIRDAGLKTPEDILRFDDIRYGDKSPWQALDVYRPRAAEGRRLPVIVSVHGGAWVYGDKERYQFYCMSLAQRGFAVVNFSYRLAPEWKFPASLEDTNAVFAWVLAHAEAYDMDPARVFAVGDSAGAHLLCLYCCLCVNPDYAARFDFAPPAGFVPRAVALNCGAYVVNGPGREQGNAAIADLMPQGGTPEEIDWISPLKHMTSAFPPAFLMTANRDFLKPQAPLLAARLAELDVPFVYRYYGGPDTPLHHVFHCDIRTPSASLCNDEECAFFRGQRG